MKPGHLFRNPVGDPTTWTTNLLLIWRQSVPLEETLAAFETLNQSGDIRQWGVSNFDTADMKELVGLPGVTGVATNQVLYNLTSRGMEFDLLPWCRRRRIPLMVYSPIEQGRLLKNATLRRVALRRSVTPAQVALAWVLQQDGSWPFPRSATPTT